MAVQLQPAFVLHTRPFRDSSLLVDVLTEQYGRVGMLARGQRQAKSRARQPLQPFCELLVSWTGRGELKTLTTSDYHRILPPLAGRRLYSGLYANELLVRVLPQADPCPAVYHSYQQFLTALTANTDETATSLEPLLRRFELAILQALGYQIDLTTTVEGLPITAASHYRYQADAGFYPVTATAEEGVTEPTIFVGEELQQLAAGDYSGAATRRAAKRLLRQALAPHLGDRPLKSRELFTR